MTQSSAAAISDALLYEGYLLYPYRDSAIKNQYRWMFGCLFPERWCREHEPSDRDRLHSELLVGISPQAEIDIRLRCLVLTNANQADREPQPSERQVSVDGIRPTDCVDHQRTESFCLASDSSTEPILGQLQIECVEVASDVFRMSIEIRNITDSGEQVFETRNMAACQALLSTQLSLVCRNARFISLTDPPANLKTAARECRNDGCWPVLAGLPGTHDQMLISPIILDDYPQVAPESQGDMFDGTEIDELLTMRIRTLTDREKTEMAETDPRALDLLQRTETLPVDELRQMHGEMRRLSTVPQSPDQDIAPESLQIDGIELRPGDQVRLHPKGRNDIFDLALAGQAATIATIERDFENQLYVTVTAECDPGRDFGQAGLPGHRFFFRPDEVEPLLQGKSVEP